MTLLSELWTQSLAITILIAASRTAHLCEYGVTTTKLTPTMTTVALEPDTRTRATQGLPLRARTDDATARDPATGRTNTATAIPTSFASCEQTTMITMESLDPSMTHTGQILPVPPTDVTDARRLTHRRGDTRRIRHGPIRPTRRAMATTATAILATIATLLIAAPTTTRISPSALLRTGRHLDGGGKLTDGTHEAQRQPPTLPTLSLGTSPRDHMRAIALHPLGLNISPHLVFNGATGAGVANLNTIYPQLIDKMLIQSTVGGAIPYEIHVAMGSPPVVANAAQTSFGHNMLDGAVTLNVGPRSNVKRALDVVLREDEHKDLHARSLQGHSVAGDLGAKPYVAEDGRGNLPDIDTSALEELAEQTNLDPIDPPTEEPQLPPAWLAENGGPVDAVFKLYGDDSDHVSMTTDPDGATRMLVSKECIQDFTLRTAHGKTVGEIIDITHQFLGANSFKTDAFHALLREVEFEPDEVDQSFSHSPTSLTPIDPDLRGEARAEAIAAQWELLMEDDDRYDPVQCAARLQCNLFYRRYLRYRAKLDDHKRHVESYRAYTEQVTRIHEGLGATVNALQQELASYQAAAGAMRQNLTQTPLHKFRETEIKSSGLTKTTLHVARLLARWRAKAEESAGEVRLSSIDDQTKLPILDLSRLPPSVVIGINEIVEQLQALEGMLHEVIPTEGRLLYGIRYHLRHVIKEAVYGPISELIGFVPYPLLLHVAVIKSLSTSIDNENEEVVRASIISTPTVVGSIPDLGPLGAEIYQYFDRLFELGLEPRMREVTERILECFGDFRTTRGYTPAFTTFLEDLKTMLGQHATSSDPEWHGEKGAELKSSLIECIGKESESLYKTAKATARRDEKKTDTAIFKAATSPATQANAGSPPAAAASPTARERVIPEGNQVHAKHQDMARLAPPKNYPERSTLGDCTNGVCFSVFKEPFITNDGTKYPCAGSASNSCRMEIHPISRQELSDGEHQALLKRVGNTKARFKLNPAVAALYDIWYNDLSTTLKEANPGFPNGPKGARNRPPSSPNKKGKNNPDGASGGDSKASDSFKGPNMKIMMAKIESCEPAVWKTLNEMADEKEQQEQAKAVYDVVMQRK